MGAGAAVLANTVTPEIPVISITPYFDESGAAAGVDVRYEVKPGRSAQDAAPMSLFYNTFSPYLDRNTDSIAGLTAIDAIGPVTFTQAADSSLYGLTMQTWTSDRAIKGTLAVSYRVPVALAHPKRRGPHMELQTAGQGLSGTFTSFMLIPYLGESITTSMVWNLPAGQRFVSSMGEGSLAIQASVTDFLFTQFLAGPLFTYPEGDRSKGLSLFALGRSSRECHEGAMWIEQVYRQMQRQLGGDADEPFRIFIRSYDGGPLSSGSARPNAYTLYLAPEDKLNSTDIHCLIAHETVHAFTGRLASLGNDSDWYNEGIADFLALTIPYDSGLYTEAEFETLVNQEAALYYTSVFRTLPARDIPRIKWSGRNAWATGYSRGCMYFINLDAKLRRDQDGTVRALDLINEITESTKFGQTANDSLWLALLAKRAGQWAVDDWNNMIAGNLIVPEPDAFAGYQVQEIRTGVFDLGFGHPLRVARGETIAHLDTASAAALAGMKEGDVISRTIDINKAYVSFDSELTIPVTRAGTPLAITYKPRQGSQVAYKWVRRAD